MSERRDYEVLISLASREEAEVAAAALRAEGVDAFVGNAEMANMHWGTVQAMGGLQIMVPARMLSEARTILRDRVNEAADDDEAAYDPSKRKDRWKAWVLLIWVLGPVAVVILIAVAGRLLAIVQDLFG
ncbi:MAG TPA: DUF2007 domain-containing protein [Hyphomonadaceae bacterium]|nr:DUF2007 domain-containing protein [Hyphomonadaceae bacterium]